jgi:hypothetical protein
MILAHHSLDRHAQQQVTDQHDGCADCWQDTAEAAVDTADENQIRTYFAAHQDEWKSLQGIAAPLRNLRNSCPQQVSAGDVARLFDAMAS